MKMNTGSGNDTQNAALKNRVAVFSKDNKELYKKDALRINILCVAVSCARIVSFLLGLLTLPKHGFVYIYTDISILFLFLVLGGLGIVGIINKKPVSIIGLKILSIFIIVSSVVPLIVSLSLSVWEILFRIPALVLGTWLFIESCLFRFTYKYDSPFDELKKENKSVNVLHTDFVYPDLHSKNRYLSKMFNTLFLVDSIFILIDLPIAFFGITSKKIVCPKVTRIWALINAAAIGAFYVYYIAFGAHNDSMAHEGGLPASFISFFKALFNLCALTVGFILAVAAAVIAWKYTIVDTEPHDKAQ